MIEVWCRAGILAEEMEAATLSGSPGAKRDVVVCFVLVTNQMGRAGADFGKGALLGSQTLLQIIGQTIRIGYGAPPSLSRLSL